MYMFWRVFDYIKSVINIYLTLLGIYSKWLGNTYKILSYKTPAQLVCEVIHETSVVENIQSQHRRYENEDFGVGIMKWMQRQKLQHVVFVILFFHTCDNRISIVESEVKDIVHRCHLSKGKYKRQVIV